MIDIFSFALGFFVGFLSSVLFIYFWIKRYISKMIKGGMALEKLIKILQESKK